MPIFSSFCFGLQLKDIVLYVGAFSGDLKAFNMYTGVVSKKLYLKLAYANGLC